MKPEPKRTTTQQGLGKVNADERRATREREAVKPEAAEEKAAESVPPITVTKRSAPPVIPRESMPPPSSSAPPRSSPPKSTPTRSLGSSSTKSAAPPSGSPKGAPKGGGRSIPPRNTLPKGVAHVARVATKSVHARGRSLPPKSAPPQSAPRKSAPPQSAPPNGGRPSSREGRDPDTGTRRRALEPSASGGGSARGASRASITVDHVPQSRRQIDAVNVASRAVPKILKTKAEIAAAPIDHRAGFLLAHIDGATTVQGLVDIAGMPEEDVHEILDRLRRLGIVQIR